MRRALLIAPILMVLAVLSGEARAALPVVEEVEWAPFRDHCRQLLQALDKTGSPLPLKTVRALTTLLDRRPDDPEAASAAVQKLLDAHCLIGVSINPESRVKAARGPAAVVLHRDRPKLVLIKVHNDGGVTHALRLHGPGLIHASERGEDRWLEAKLVTDAPFAAELTGRRVEYRLLRLTPRQSGKREATFQLDVGQGTQDLGFRAEVPILFTVRKADWTSP
ncbi:MAG TPA: hypothetical protein VMG10_13540 [Gemmataceae bacterium]|nr:hypothetical protein [Gemmataceae bacterium]